MCAESAKQKPPQAQRCSITRSKQRGKGHLFFVFSMKNRDCTAEICSSFDSVCVCSPTPTFDLKKKFTWYFIET